MAKRKVFTAWDSKVKTHLDPFIALNSGEAQRIMEDMVNHQNGPFSRYPEDFTLFELGDYDDETGRYEMYAAKRPICTLIELKKGEKTSGQNTLRPAVM